MNPLTKVKLVSELSEREAATAVTAKASWHSAYKASAWVFLGGLPYGLTEGDILCVFSQYGEIVNINLVRDRKTGESKGFCFVCYEDQRSTILAVDNFNGIQIKGRTIRVDHVSHYRPPRPAEARDAATRELWEKGCRPQTPSSSSSEGAEDEARSEQHEQEKRKRNKTKEKTAVLKRRRHRQSRHRPCQPEARLKWRRTPQAPVNKPSVFAFHLYKRKKTHDMNLAHVSEYGSTGKT
ncbi:hypothetical protein HPG69_006927 [Diceros bicornis minor]|uniref:RNA-binding motif protein, X-linked 2 n=1 Tax=Diceros bicornis minor TaxID=77932 RepID=A0A7J7F9Q4_DICBM|nr:hypothetical protein HPG69_006927 [Diceros bicornis minor]